jgi:hypothetical protein
LTFKVAHWDTLNDSLAVQYARQTYFFNKLVTNVICVYFCQLIDHCET